MCLLEAFVWRLNTTGQGGFVPKQGPGQKVSSEKPEISTTGKVTDTIRQHPQRNIAVGLCCGIIKTPLSLWASSRVGGAQLLLCLSAGIWSLKDTKLHVHLESPKGAQHSRQAQWSSRRATTTAAARQAFCPVIFLLCTRCVFILISSSVKEWKVPSESWDRVSVLLLLQTREATYRLCVHMFSQPHSMLVNTVIFRGSTFSYYCFISLFICEHKQSDKSNKTKCNKQIRDCAGEVRNPKGLIVKTSPLWFKVYPNRIQSMILILWTFYSLTWWEKEKKTGFWKRNTTWKFWFP